MTGNKRKKKGDGNSGESLSQNAYTKIFNQIMDRTLAGGSVIQERKMAAEFGISRTPMRKALARLEGEGLLIRLTDRLLSVKVISLSECLDAYYVRKLIEPETTRLATPRIQKEQIKQLMTKLSKLTKATKPTRAMHWAFDDELHGMIAERSGNVLMVQTISHLRRTTKLFEQLTVPVPAHSPGTDDHLHILTAIDSGNADKAAEAMREHLEKARQRILDKV